MGGCPQRPSAPESRAVYFVEKLIREPQAIDDLRAVAVFPDGRGPAAFLDDLAVRTAITFLQARVRLDTDLRIHSRGASAPSPERRLVTVSVNEGLAIGTALSIQFQVELVRRENEWMVIHIAAR